MTTEVEEAAVPHASRPEALDLLRGAPVGVTSPEDVQQARAKLVPWLEARVAELPQQRQRHLNQRRRRQRVLRSGIAVAAAAAAAVFLLLPTQQVTPESKSESAVAGGHLALVAGKLSQGHLLTGARHKSSNRLKTGAVVGASLVAKAGYHLELGPRSELSVLLPGGADTPSEASVGAGHERAGNESAGVLRSTALQLHHGIAHLSVASRPSSAPLVVVTDDAKVTVIGTAFSVEVRPEQATCIRVEEGEVLVERSASSRSLHAGQDWGCEDVDVKDTEQESAKRPLQPNQTQQPNQAQQPHQTQREPSRAESAKVLSKTPRRASQHRPRASTPNVLDKALPPGGPSALEVQNRLLTKALAAESRGNSAQARRAYHQLLRRYPKSPFTQDAKSGLARTRMHKDQHSQDE